MMKKRILTAVALCGAVWIGAAAQRDNRHFEKGALTVMNNDTADVSRVERHLKENAPVSPNDNGLPRFSIIGKNHEFYLGIGAQFLGEAAFDFGDNVASPILFAPSAMTAAAPGSGAALRFGWQSSSVYINAVAMPGTDNQVGIFFKGNFTGANDSFSCYHFYGRYRGLKAGYTASAFTDEAAEPMTIDFEGPNGYPYLTVFNASWTQKFSANISGAIGLDAPTASLSGGRDASQVSQRLPAVPLYLQYAWAGGGSHLRLSGLLRPLQYRNLAKGENSTLMGTGVQLSGMSTIAGPISASINAAFGRGIANYLQDDNGLELDAVTVSDAGRMAMVKTLGLTASLTCNFDTRLSANLVFSHLSNWLPDGAIGQGDSYRYGDYLAANLIYNINRFVSAGIEYDYGHRKSFSGDPLHANRLQMQLALTF